MLSFEIAGVVLSMFGGILLIIDILKNRTLSHWENWQPNEGALFKKEMLESLLKRTRENPCSSYTKGHIEQLESDIAKVELEIRFHNRFNNRPEPLGIIYLSAMGGGLVMFIAAFFFNE